LFYFASDDITGSGITEATFFHLLYGFDGLDIFNFSTYVALALAAFAAIGLICFIAWRLCARRSKPLFQYRRSRVIHVTVIGALSIFAVGVHPATLQTIDVAQALYDSRYASVLNEALRSFGDVKPAAQGKSLVYIYAESLERTFLNHRAFPGLTPKLSEMERSSLSIHGIGQSPLTDWTVAGMVASQCGMPLATFRHDGNNLSDLSSFIPGATCIGDLLNERGYQLAYIGGADLHFAGKGRFYSDHKFEDITGLNELRARYGEDIPVSKWS
jgi:phosphoglycerol transferase